MDLRMCKGLVSAEADALEDEGSGKGKLGEGGQSAREGESERGGGEGTG